jgi:hypothetical protein
VIFSTLLTLTSWSPFLFSTLLGAHLLTFAKDTNEIYAQKIYSELAGRSFAHICQCALDGRGKNAHVIPIGIRRGNNTYLNPSDAKTSSFQAGDILFAICDNAIALDRLMNDAVRAE